MQRTFPAFGYNPSTGEWNDSLNGDYLWSNANLSEAVPEVMTPSTWSLLWIYFFEIQPVQFPGNAPICGNIAGRPYFNLSLISSLYHSVGMDGRKERFGDLLGSIPAGLDIPYLPFSPLAVAWKVLPGMIEDRLKTRRDRRQVREYVSFLPDWCRTMRPCIEQSTHAEELLSLWTETIRPTILCDYRFLRSMTISLSALATRLKQDLTALVGAAEACTLLSNLSGAAGDLESLGPLLGLAQVQDGRLTGEEYLQRYGHRGPREAELSAPVPADDPQWLENQLANFSGSAVNGEALLAKQRAECGAAWQRFAARFPRKAPALRQQLDLAAAAARNREAVRSESIRLSRLIRQFLLRVGSVTGIGEDIFFLTLDEMTALLAGDQQPLSRIPARRETYFRCRALPAYPALLFGRFDPFGWAADPHRRCDFGDARQATAAVASAVIQGAAGALGCVEGIVRRIDCLENGNQIQPGEILVTTLTNIGWTLLFPRLAAIVTDTGAPLSHTAIVAREMGIPAVVGCGNATMLLKTGDHVRVDGGKGTVEILSGSFHAPGAG